jgi:hypothetical protein
LRPDWSAAASPHFCLSAIFLKCCRVPDGAAIPPGNSSWAALPWLIELLQSPCQVHLISAKLAGEEMTGPENPRPKLKDLERIGGVGTVTANRVRNARGDLSVPLRE